MTAATARQLLDGCAAITESAIAAGCRFFAGYPISPFTGLLENMSRRLPEAGGHCLNAESEIEAVNMALGASASGARARAEYSPVTVSCGRKARKLTKCELVPAVWQRYARQHTVAPAGADRGLVAPDPGGASPERLARKTPRRTEQR